MDTIKTRKTPEGYNENDYWKVGAFLEQPDDEGVKNGDKLSKTYDPNNPETWGTYDDYGIRRFKWIESDGKLRIQEIDIPSKRLCGTLDVSGCTALEELWCWSNNLTELVVSDCTLLKYLNCCNTYLSKFDITGCPSNCEVSFYHIRGRVLYAVGYQEP